MRIVELKIDELDNYSGFTEVALVENPAIEADFHYFNKQDTDDAIAFQTVKMIFIEHLEKEFDLDITGLPNYVNETSGSIIEKDSVSQEFKYIDDLSIEIQDKIVETLEDKGITLDSLLKEGWEVFKEEEIGEEQFGLPTKSDAKPDAYTDEGTQKLKVLYQYRGPYDEKNRKFCSRMMSMTEKYGLLWRKEDIDRLTILGKNEEFSLYDVFQYKGSFGCRHRWTKVYLKREQVTPLEDTKLSKLSFSIDQEKRLIVGPLMLADKLILRVDENDEPYYVYFSKETIKEIATKMMKEKLLDRVNIEHNEEDRVEAFMVESWIVEDQYKDKQQVFGLSYPPGSWVGMYKVLDDRAWEMVKEGRVKGFSIEGFFENKYIQNAKTI